MSVTPSRAGDEVWIKGENQGTREVPEGGLDATRCFSHMPSIRNVIPDRPTVVINFRYQVTSVGRRTCVIMYTSDEFQPPRLFLRQGA